MISCVEPIPYLHTVAQPFQDLVFIEEAFERMLLDYDRVFSAMGVPACLWRRTGEIYKANREFAELVGMDTFMMRDVRFYVLPLPSFPYSFPLRRVDFVYTSLWRRSPQ